MATRKKRPFNSVKWPSGSSFRFPGGADAERQRAEERQGEEADTVESLGDVVTQEEGWAPGPLSEGGLVRQCSSARVQFSSVAQSCPTLCDPMNYSTPGLPVHHQLPEFTQTHVH